MATPLAYRLELTGDVEAQCSVSRLKPLTLGRDADVRIDCASVSRVNTRILLTEKGLLVEDLDSLNGTFLNDERIEHAELRDGDTLRIGGAEVKVSVSHGDVATARATMLRPALDLGLLDGSQPTGEDTVPETRSRHGILKHLGAEGFSDLERLLSRPPHYLLNARRTVLDQPVTLKVIDTARASRVESERFLREAKIAARLSHPSVARLYDARMAGKLMYMILERLTGETLLDEIDGGGAGSLSVERALALALPVLRALVYAHGEKVIHRDLRPENIRIGAQGDVKLTGFGLAKTLAGAVVEPTSEVKLTRHMEGLGSVAYAAPEQLAGTTSPSALCDVYSFGACFYHALSGTLPLTTEGEELEPIARLRPDLPASLAKVIDRCLRHNPAERFWGAREVLVAVEAIVREVYGFKGRSADLDLLVRYGARAEGAAAGAGRRAPERSPRSPAFSGSFARDELVELVQMVELNRKSGLLEITGKSGRSGQVHIEKGMVIRVRSRGQRGVGALIALLSLDGGQFRLSLEPPRVEAEDRIAIGPLLMEVMRRRDEHRFAGA